MDSGTTPGKIVFNTNIISKIKQKLVIENLEAAHFRSSEAAPKRKTPKNPLGLKCNHTVHSTDSTASVIPPAAKPQLSRKAVFFSPGSGQCEEGLKSSAQTHTQNNIDSLREEYNQLLKKLVDQQSEITRLKKSATRNKEDNKSVTRLRGYCNRLSAQLTELREENKKLKWDLHRATGSEVKSKPKRDSKKSKKEDQIISSEVQELSIENNEDDQEDMTLNEEGQEAPQSPKKKKKTFSNIDPRTALRRKKAYNELRNLRQKYKRLMAAHENLRSTAQTHDELVQQSLPTEMVQQQLEQT